jgi:hypothetical protein
MQPNTSKSAKTQKIIDGIKALAMFAIIALVFAIWHSGSAPQGKANVPTQADLQNAQYLSDKYGVAAEAYCPVAADNYLRTVAKYDFAWDEGEQYGRFDHTLGLVDHPGVLTLYSEKAKLQNGFGAYTHIVLYCYYDTQAQTASFRAEQ